MENGSKNKLAEALREASLGNERSKVARLREIFDDVKSAKANGLSHKRIVATLEDKGLVFTQGTFDITWHRISKEMEEKRKSSINKKEEIGVATPDEEVKNPQKSDLNVSSETKEIRLQNENDTKEKQKKSTQEVKSLMKNEIDLSQYE